MSIFKKTTTDPRFGEQSRLKWPDDKPAGPPMWAWAGLGVAVVLAVNLHFGWIGF